MFKTLLKTNKKKMNIQVGKVDKGQGETIY